MKPWHPMLANGVMLFLLGSASAILKADVAVTWGAIVCANVYFCTTLILIAVEKSKDQNDAKR